MRTLFSFVALTLLIFSLWAVLHPWTSQHLSFPISRVLAKIAFILGMILLICWWTTPAAAADVTFSKEADQWIYRSQQILFDTENNTWNVTAFKHMDEGNKGFYLRVEAVSNSSGYSLFFPLKTSQLDAVAPLTVTTRSGETLTIKNVTRQQFIGALPEPGVGQYDARSLLPQLEMAQSLRLQLATKETEHPVTIDIPSKTVEEWLIVGSCDYIMCTQNN